MNCSRRRLLQAVAAALRLAPWLAASAARPDSGVQLGAQTFSFREIPLDGMDHTDAVVKDLRACGLTECELFAPQIEPGGDAAGMAALLDAPARSGRGRGAQFDPDAIRKARAAQKQWRLTVPLSHFQEIRRKFNDAGIRIFTYNFTYSSSADSSDEELERSFQMARALGCKAINASTTLTMIRRLAPFAEKHQMVIAGHGHSDVSDPDQFATRESFVRAFAISKWVGANLDIGHYFAAGGDPVEFIESFHDRITNVHLKDRKKEQGPNMPWGQGDTPIRQVLLLLKEKKYPIPAFIEYEYRGASDPVPEVTRCYKYCQDILRDGTRVAS
jgi:sugar phosphate isomerase/epimerase